MANLAADPSLIGQPGSRALIPTPAAVLDLDAFERNVAKMAARAWITPSRACESAIQSGTGFTQAAFTKIVHRFVDLLARVHHERTILDYRLPQGLAGNEDQPGLFR